MNDDVPDDLTPEVGQEVVLNAAAFKHIQALAKVGAITSTALVIDLLDLPYERYEALCAYFGQMNRSCSFWIGDLLKEGEQRYGEKYAQAASATGLAEQTLMNRVYVCGKVPPERRVPGLPFSFHALVAPLPAGEQRKWLRLAQQNGWRREELAYEIRRAKLEQQGELEETTGEERDDPPIIEEHIEPGVLITQVKLVLSKAVRRDGGYWLPAEEIDRLNTLVGG